MRQPTLCPINITAMNYRKVFVIKEYGPAAQKEFPIPVLAEINVADIGINPLVAMGLKGLKEMISCGISHAHSGYDCCILAEASNAENH